VLDFGAFPPEINSGLMYTGPGPGQMLAAANAWDKLADELSSTAASYGSVTSLSAITNQAEQTATEAKAAVAAYETAFAMTVPPRVIAANRALLTLLAATNFFGQNAPAIAAAEAHYMEMWAQDAAAMYGYAGSASAAAAHAEMYQVTSAMAARVHDLSGTPGVTARGSGTHASARAIASGPGRTCRGRAWLARPIGRPSEPVLEEVSPCRS